MSEINFHHSARRSSFEEVLGLTWGLSVLETKSILKRANSFLPRPFFLNRLVRSVRRVMQVRPGTHRAIQDNVEQCRAMQGNAEESRAIQEIAGTHSVKRHKPRDRSAAQIHSGDFQEDTGRAATAR
jgi:hypothetical protein